MKTVIIATIAALLAGATGATASSVVPHIFGHGGKVYQLDAQCHRPSFPPSGISDHEGLNVTGQQVWCLIRRKAKSDACIKQLGPVPNVEMGHTHRDGTSDWAGVRELRDYVANLELCVRTK